MKKLLLGASMLCFSMTFANDVNGDVTKNEETVFETETVDTSTGDWGCYGELSVRDDESGEWIVVKTYSICCYDTPEQACAAVEQELDLVASYY